MEERIAMELETLRRMRNIGLVHDEEYDYAKEVLARAAKT